MAEGFARYYALDAVDVDSAGTRPVGVNPYAVWAMNEAGIDISGQTSDPVEEKDLQSYDYVVTLCGDARDHCPPLPPHVKVAHWPLPDPARVKGSPRDIIAAFRHVRNEIERRVKGLLKEILTAQAQES